MLDLEPFGRLKAPKVCQETAGEAFDAIVPSLHGRIIGTAGSRDLGFDFSEVALEVEEMPAGFEIGIVFRDRKKTAHSLRNSGLLLCSLTPLGGQRLSRVAGLDDGFEDLLLVLGKAFYGFDQVGHKVPATAKLHIDGGERITHRVATANEPIVEAYEDEQGEDDEPTNEKERFHTSLMKCS